MPELPEVETIRQDLSSLVLGKEITSVILEWEPVVACPSPDAFCQQVVGQRIVNVGRRGKWLVLELSGGASLLIHLRMTGRLQVSAPSPEHETHTRAILGFGDGTFLYYVDQRKFGRLHLLSDPGVMLDDLGPEPLAPEFTAEGLYQRLQDHRRMIKPLLLDQQFIAGMGNIYVDEALYRAGIHPLRKSNDLSRDEADRLHEAIVSVLSSAIANRGTTLSDYRDGRGTEGSNQHYLQVVRRAGERCPKCGRTIERMVVAQRGTYICPACQRLEPDHESHESDE